MKFWQPNSPLSGLPYVKDGRSARSSSWDSTGGNRDFAVVAPGDTHVLADIRGAGVIEHIWMTTRCYSEKYLRKLVLEMYWDGHGPERATPLGDFFGVGHATCVHYVSLPLNMVFGPRRGPKGPFAAAMNCYFPMPFRSGADRAPQRERAADREPLLLRRLRARPTSRPDGRRAVPRRLQPRRSRAAGRASQPTMRTRRRGTCRARTLTGDDNYVILDTEGTGHYVGCVLSIDNFDASNQTYTWPGEGDDMIFIDGEAWPPSLHGTGTEDYFNTAWGFPSGEPTPARTTGSPSATTRRSTSACGACTASTSRTRCASAESIRVTIEHGHANDQGNDYSGCRHEQPGRWERGGPARCSLRR